MHCCAEHTDSENDVPPEVNHRRERDREWRRALSSITFEGAFSNVFVIVTGGAFLSGLAIFLGAGDFEIGLLASIPFLSQVMQLCSGYLADLTGGYKTLAIRGLTAGRTVWVLIIPLLFTTLAGRFEIFLLIVLISSASIMLATPAWLTWMSHLVPAPIRGRYFGRRNTAIALSTVLTTLSAGFLIDQMRALDMEPVGFSALIILAVGFGLAASHRLKRLPYWTPELKHGACTFKDVLRPFKDAQYVSLLKTFFLWNFAIGISAIFFAVHMLEFLKMSFVEISLYSVIVSSVAVFCSKPWGKLIDRFGSRSVLGLSALGIAFIPLIWWLPRPDFIWILAFEAIYTGILWAGFNLAAFNMPIAASPEKERASYLAAYSVVSGLAFFAASILGGLISESLSGLSFTFGPQTIINYHILFAVSSLLRFFAVLTLIRYKGPTEKGVPILINFMGHVILRRLALSIHFFPHLIRKSNHIIHKNKDH
jgi:MFS family permease